MHLQYNKNSLKYKLTHMNHAPQNAVKINSLIVLIFVVLMAALSQFASDNYLPSFPAIATTLNMHEGLVQFSITTYFLGMGLSQLVYGPLADVYGRKPMLLIGYVIFIIASLVCTLANNGDTFLLGRFLQGVGAGGMGALFRVLMRDCYSGKAFAKVASYVGMVFSLTPPLAPIVGGYIQYAFGWRGNFVLLTVAGVVLALSIWALLPETLAPKYKHRLDFKKIMANYRILLSNHVFMNHAIIQSMVLSTIIIYLSASTFLMQNTLNLTPIEYGWLAVFYSVSIASASMINANLVGRYGGRFMMIIGVCTMLLGAISLLTLGLLGFLSVTAVVIPVMILFFGCGFIFPNAMTGAFEPFAAMAGSAGAIFGCTQLLITATMAIFAALIPDQSQIPLALVLLIPPMIIVLNLYLARAKN